jgi:iron complex outermembrane receptor protein
MVRNASAFLSGACALATILAAPAAAQSPAGASSDESEIIVTARKRQESILKVPVVENVVTSKIINNYGIGDFSRLATKVPGLLVGGSVLGVGSAISIRGVGTSAPDQGIDQSVALNVDGLVMNQGLAFRASLFDLAQVEVLKGPQALFYGKNSPGGVVSLRTADPGNELEIIGRTGYEGEAREWRSELIVSGPLTDTFGVRLAGQYSDMKGFFHNDAVAQTATGAVDPKYKRLDNTEAYVIRGTALWKPTSNFSARLKANFTKDLVKGSSGATGQLVYCPDGIVPPPSGVQFLAPTEDCKLNRTINVVDLNPANFPAMTYDGVPFLRLIQRFGTIDLNYSPSDTIALTSVTGYYWSNLHSGINATVTGYAGGAIEVENHYHRRETTEELRAETSFDSPVNFSTGAFYQDGYVSNYVLTAGNSAYRLPAKLAQGTNNFTIKTYSLFGQARWKITSQFEAAGGVRWTDETRKLTAINFITGTPVNTPVATPKVHSSTFSPEFSLTYTPTDELTVFGRVAQGYKSGSFSLASPVTVNQDNAFGDERVRGGELGVKSRLFDRTLFLNFAGYLYKYRGLQVGATILSPAGIPALKVVNAGASKIYGFDFDYTWRTPIEGLSLNGSINYTHARFTKLNNAPCYGGQTIAAGCNLILNPVTKLFTAQDLSGTPLIRAPDWQLAGGFEYETDVGSGLKMEFAGDGQYSSRYAGALSARPQTYQKAYALFNGQVSIGDSADHWKLQFIVNNIANKIVAGTYNNSNFANGAVLGGEVTGGTGSGVAGVDEVSALPKRGRELWVRLTIKPVGWFH